MVTTRKETTASTVDKSDVTCIDLVLDEYGQALTSTDIESISFSVFVLTGGGVATPVDGYQDEDLDIFSVVHDELQQVPDTQWFYNFRHVVPAAAFQQDPTPPLYRVQYKFTRPSGAVNYAVINLRPIPVYIAPEPAP